jgi:hypothetical protein
MPKTIRIILALALAAAVFVVAAGCGSADEPAGTSPAPTRTAAATPAAPGDGSSAGPSAALRAEVHADIRRIMTDIKAAEKRGDVIDGVPVGQSSNPYDYVGISPAFTGLVALGKPALPAIVAEIKASDNDGLREYLLAAAGAQISGDTPGSGSQTWSSGKEWARQQGEE